MSESHSVGGQTSEGVSIGVSGNYGPFAGKAKVTLTTKVNPWNSQEYTGINLKGSAGFGLKAGKLGAACYQSSGSVTSYPRDARARGHRRPARAAASFTPGAGSRRARNDRRGDLPVKDDASVWTFAQRSRKAGSGVGFLSLGLLFIALAAKGRFRTDSDRWMVYIGLFILLLGALFARASWRRGKRQLRIAREGIETEARVTAVGRARLMRSSTKVIIGYSYADQFGGTHQGESGYLPDDEANWAWKPGDKCAVRFDPEDPAESVWMAAK